ncbi:MAG: DNA phosphorothioation-dependent restriction protein DptF [Vibrio sp.]|uniref:DNA phosphorothioation-dependent restriction protein DptF n=1 Tax=Vibrio sp. TaxID=678 RepID=UPI003A8AC058
MEFIKALSLLSKSSPFAVSTENPEHDSDLVVYKSYLYIKTDIEADFEKALLKSRSGEIIFLCGSSGDGKSEILTRYSKKHRTTTDFHLDATHSFSPNQTAINALDDRFTAFKSNNRPLVIGINTGMLGNYAEEGADEHDDIKTSIKQFLSGQPTPKNHTYLDFESYPKFHFSDGVSHSDFTEKFLIQLTQADWSNPFYVLYEAEKERSGWTKLCTNFALLSNFSIQKTIVELLLKSRLMKDQFLTARSLLDFVYQMLSMKGYLFDNLFTAIDNEILEQLRSFDPSATHTRDIDEFILQFGLGIENSGYVELKRKLAELGITDIASPRSFLRAIYLLKHDDSFTNGYSQQLINSFDNRLVDRYANIWLLHRDYDGTPDLRNELNKFYRESLIPAVHNYCNRNAPFLEKGTYFVSEYNGYRLATELDIKPDFHSIQTQPISRISGFDARLKIGDDKLKVIPININLFQLLEGINHGYRPNKHDKNSILQLDDVIEQIISTANNNHVLHVFSDQMKFKVVKQDSDYFEVSGI